MKQYMFLWYNTYQFTHSKDITMNHTFNNGNSVLENSVDVYVYINTKLIDSCNVPIRTSFDFFVKFI